MIRIIHLSDLHVRSKSSRDENSNASALVREIVRRYGTGQKSKTFVVITGDLVDDGKLVQYKQLERTVIKPLRSKFTVLAVPGNHDYALWGNNYDRRAPARFSKYVRKIPQYPEPRIDTCSAANERKVVFIGIDSADPKDQVFSANGIVDKQQRNRLKAILTNTKYEDHFGVLYVHHHPFLRDWFVSFKEADEFLDLIKGNVHMVLFGHKHVHETFFRRYEIPAMLASGKVTKSVADAIAFRVIDIEKTGEPAIYTLEVPAP